MGVGNQGGTQTQYKHVELHFKSVLRRFIQIATSAATRLCYAASVPNYSGKNHISLEKMNSLKKIRRGYASFLKSRVNGDLNVAAQKWQCIQKVTFARLISSCSATMAGFESEVFVGTMRAVISIYRHPATL